MILFARESKIWTKIRKETKQGLRPLQNIQFCSSSRKAKILTTGIYWIFRGLKFETDAEIGQKGTLCRGLRLSRGFFLPESSLMNLGLLTAGSKQDSPVYCSKSPGYLLFNPRRSLLSNQGLACSSWAARRNSVASSPNLPIK